VCVCGSLGGGGGGVGGVIVGGGGGRIILLPTRTRTVSVEAVLEPTPLMSSYQHSGVVHGTAVISGVHKKVLHVHDGVGEEERV
jgi:hypothetical protein